MKAMFLDIQRRKVAFWMFLTRETSFDRPGTLENDGALAHLGPEVLVPRLTLSITTGWLVSTSSKSADISPRRVALSRWLPLRYHGRTLWCKVYSAAARGLSKAEGRAKEDKVDLLPCPGFPKRCAQRV